MGKDIDKSEAAHFYGPRCTYANSWAPQRLGAPPRLPMSQLVTDAGS